MHETAWKCMEMHGNAWKCMEMHGNAWKCMEMQSSRRDLYNARRTTALKFIFHLEIDGIG